MLINPIVISKQTARRFVLGKQGLWPGRRWKGKKGTAQAILACEAVQLDPLNIVARARAKKLFGFEYFWGCTSPCISVAGDITHCRSCMAMTWWRG